MLALNVNIVCQVQLSENFLPLPKHEIYGSNLHDPNKGKVGTWLLNGVKKTWYCVCSFLHFCLELTLGKDAWMRASFATVMVISSKVPF